MKDSKQLSENERHDIMTRTVTVEAVGIQNIRTGDDPGDDLEIYGHLAAWSIFGVNTPVEEIFLMNKMNPDDAQSITQGSTLHLGKKTRDFNIEDNQKLRVGGHLKEQDTNPNDSLGDRHVEIEHNDLTPGETRDIRVEFSESNQLVEAIFIVTVRPLPPPES